jgi:hypothetical protein
MTGHFWSLIAVLSLLTPLAAAEGQESLYSDDFGTFHGGWGEASETAYVDHNRFFLRLGVDQSRIAMHSTLVTGDLDLRVEITEIAGGVESMAGIALWALDDVNCLTVGLTSEGDLVVKSFSEAQRSLPLPATPNRSLRKGLGQTNELRIVARGNRLTIYVNGTQAVAMRSFPPAVPTKFGLYGQSLGQAHTWAYSNLSVRRPPPEELAVPKDSSLLLDENFDSLDPGWGEANETAFVRNDRLILEPAIGRYVRRLYAGTRFVDADVRILVVKRRGDVDGNGGVIFWASSAENYAFAYLTSEGSLQFGRRINNETKVRSSVADPVIRRGIGEVNEIRVLIGGEGARIIVNDKELGKLSGNAPTAGGMVGVYGEGSAKASGVWEFSKLQVRKPH